ncbi:hypothetical protein CJF30_00002751 [Rutstroemia sp. NJR-2017a BBW]|nr:hypothetical protein CJF30_00002751 [Rutstroemia sp. NJR-2017a BBW]
MAETITAASLAIVCQVYLSPIPEPSTLKIVSTYFSGNLVLLLFLLRGGLGIVQTTTKLTHLNIVFLLTATIFTLIRRLYFSPLSHIPGPSRFALTKLFLANEYFQGRAALTTRALHQEYQADVVRIVQEIMRNILREMAFANSSFKEYNRRIEHHVNKMMTVLHKAGDKEVDFSKAAENMVFDMYANLVINFDPTRVLTLT